MRARPVAILSAALLGAVLTAPPTGAGDPGRESVGALFEARCASCHYVPDPSVATDRAWLDQINRTS